MMAHASREETGGGGQMKTWRICLQVTEVVLERAEVTFPLSKAEP